MKIIISCNPTQTCLIDLTANQLIEEHICWLHADFFFHPQQHPFFTSHEAKETDVASFVKVILGDWVAALTPEGGEGKKLHKKTNKQKSTNRSPPLLICLTPPSRMRQTEAPEEKLMEWKEESVLHPTPPTTWPSTWHHLTGEGWGWGGNT